MIEDINTAFLLAKEVSNSKNWMMIPLFAAAFAVTIPSIAQMSNKITQERARRWLIYFAIGFFGWAAIIIIALVNDHHYWESVDQEIDLHIGSLNCDEYLEFLFWAENERPRWWYESKQEKYQQKYFEQCGGESK